MAYHLPLPTSLTSMPVEIIAMIADNIPKNHTASLLALYHSSTYIRRALGDRFWQQNCHKRFPDATPLATDNWLETYIRLHRTRCVECGADETWTLAFPFYRRTYGRLARICFRCDRKYEALYVFDTEIYQKYALDRTDLEKLPTRRMLRVTSGIGGKSCFYYTTLRELAERAAVKRYGSLQVAYIAARHQAVQK